MDEKIVSPTDTGKMLSPISSEKTMIEFAECPQALGFETKRSSTKANDDSISPISPSTRTSTSNLDGKPRLQNPARIKTRTLDMTSGFEYNRVLFDLRIDPGKWDEFSHDVAEATKLSSNDKAAVIATIAGFSMVGLAGVGVCMGGRVREKVKLKRVKVNREDGGGLAQVLQSWNENYFKDFGVEAWIEVNEAALRDEAKKTGEEVPDFVRRERSFAEKTPLVLLSKETRKRRAEEKKYMVVLRPIQTATELDGTLNMPVEATPGFPRVPEMPIATSIVSELSAGDLIELSVDSESCHSRDSALSDPFADPPEHASLR